jgi:hypothetical protein
VKTSFVYFNLALASGVALALKAYLPFPAFVGHLTPVYFHLFMVGWITQLIFGVVYWMFPKLSRENPRGSDSLAWGTFFTLNAGLILRVFAEPGAANQEVDFWRLTLAISALLQWLAGLGFVLNTWPRVKGR